MMGAHHAISGAAAWIAVTSTAPYALGLDPQPTATIIIGSLVTAGAALLPDVDHHNATIAHSGGAVTKAVAATAQTMSGGHRHGLHSLLAVAGFYVGTMLLGRWETEVPVLGAIPLGSALLFLALVAFALKSLKLSRGSMIKLWATAAAGTVAMLWFAPEHLEWLPTSVLIGVILHLIGDFLTVGGLPLLWPLVIKPPKALREVPVLNAIWQPNGYVAVPLLGKAGSAREWVLCVGLSLYVVIGLVDTVGGQFGASVPLPMVGA